MQYVLYSDTGSGGFSAEAALAVAGAEYRLETVSLNQNEQLRGAYLAVNPSGKIPALRLPTGEIITESAAILLTIADRHPEAKLLPPPASPARALAFRWIAFLSAEIYPIVEIHDYPQRFAPDAMQADALRERARERIRERLLVVEQAIAAPWLLTTGFSCADIYAVMFSRWSVGADWREANLPKIMRLTAQLVQMPAIAPVWQRHFA